MVFLVSVAVRPLVRGEASVTAAMTAAQLAAALAAAKSNTSGVFTLDQLRALGQTGDVNKDWLNQSDTSGLIAGGGNEVLTAKNLKAGYYTGIPGLDGAYYYDPSTGQAPAEFVKWANALTDSDRDPFTGTPKGYIPAEGGPQAAFSQRFDQTKAGVDMFGRIIAGGKGPDGTYQDSQDRALGLGKYQQFAMGADGQQVRVGEFAPDYAEPGTQSMFKKAGWTYTGTDMGWKGAADAAKQLNEYNYESYIGLMEERMLRGEDPDTGISLAETQRIYDTYNRIQDPTEKAAYIRAQDPGNLTADLRKARLDARSGERDWMKKNQIKNQVDWESAVSYGGRSNDRGQVKTTIGDFTMTDKSTGRETVYGNVPIARAYVAPVERGAVSTFGHDILSNKDSARINGGIQGLLAGIATGGALMVPAMLAGAYLGAGGPLPNARNISLTHGGGWSDWKVGEPHELTGMDLLLMVGMAVVSQGMSSFLSKYFTTPAIVGAAKPPPSMWSIAVSQGLNIAQRGLGAAKGRQATEDFMTKQRQRTGG